MSGGETMSAELKYTINDLNQKLHELKEYL